jgi:hypothetical protein
VTYSAREDAFDFTSKEKVELQLRLDFHEGVGVVEFVVRSLRAIFLLLPSENNMWTLQVVEDDRELQVLSEFQGGTKTEQASRRLSAARIVTEVGNWVQSVKEPQAVPTAKQLSRRRDPDEPRAEPTYGTMGKFLGY